MAADHHLLIGGRSTSEVAKVCAALPSAEPFVADLTDETATEAAAARVERLDAVVHSAGVLRYGEVDTLSRNDWRESLDANVIAVADLTMRLLPKLRTSSGSVVLINSGAGQRANPGWSAYAASKFALRAFADSLRAEVRGDRIRVTSIHPGRIDTDMQHELRAAEGGEYEVDRYLRPESVASAVRFALTVSEEAAIDELTIRPR